MKKLLITLFSAASAMMVATAGETRRGDIESFENRAVGAFDPSVDDNGQAVGPFLWARDDGTEGNSAADSTIEAYAEQHSTYGSNYLKVDESGTLRRKFANAENTQSDTVTLANEGEGVYVNTRVQFTASEDDVTPDATDKLIIWLKETVADETAGIAASTNLMIAATDAADIMGNTAQINYVVVNENISVVPGEWCDLKITAVRGADAGAPVFTVSLNGIKLKAVPSDNPTVTPVEEFASLTARELIALWEFTSVGFKGNGAIDHIEMGTSVREAPKNYQVGNAFFEDFTAALAAAQGAYSTESGAATLKLFADVDGGTKGIEIRGNPVIIDLNGHTITSSGDTLYVIGELTVIDSIGGGKVVSTDENAYSLYNEGGTVTVGNANGNANIFFENKVGGSLNIYGGKYVSLVDLEGYDVDFVICDDTMMMSTEAIDGYYQLVKTSGTVTYRTLTIPKVANATATVYDSEKQKITDLTQIADGATVTVRWVASSSDYKITAGAEQVITMDADTTANSPTVVAITWATVTITQVENCTIVVTQADDTPVTTGTKFDVDNKVVLTVTRTAADGYELKDCLSTEQITVTGNCTITATVVSYPSYIPEGSTETKTAFDTWVANKASGDRDTAGANMDAFLLNVAPGAAATEKTNFKITAITVNADGTVTVTTTTANSNDEPYNGKVVVKGKVDLTDADWVEKKDTHKFFKAFLEIK